ncbi:MAG: hypothetical protein WA771_06880 [Chthoniobacterales bacterium]
MSEIGGWRYVTLVLAVGLTTSACALNSGQPLIEESSAPSTGITIPGVEPDSRSGRLSAKLQLMVMDFSDQLTVELDQVFTDYVVAESDVDRQVLAQRLQLSLVTSSMMIAASRDPRAGLLDMAVFVSAGRWAADRYWIPEALGEHAVGLQSVYAEAERQIWSEVDSILTPEQTADLRALIAQWKLTANPRDVATARLRTLDGVVLSQFEAASSATGLMAHVRRLLGNVDQSLLTGERMLFYLERLPLILERQADLTVDHVAQRFPIATLNPDFDQWLDLANTLPAQIADLYAAYEPNVTRMFPEIQGSLAEVTRSLESAERISQSVQGTAASVEVLAEQIAALPFGPDDYVATLAGTTTSINQLNEIVLGLNQLLAETQPGQWEARVAELTLVLDTRAERVMNAIFLRVAILIGILIAGLLLVVVFARILFRQRRTETPTSAT